MKSVLILALLCASCATVNKTSVVSNTPDAIRIYSIDNDHCLYMLEDGVREREDGNYLVPLGIQHKCTGEIEPKDFLIINTRVNVFKNIVNDKWEPIESNSPAEWMVNYLRNRFEATSGGSVF